MKLITTNRLELHEITIADAPFYVKLLNSEMWLKYIGDRKINSVEDAEAYIIKNYLPSYALHGYGSYTVSLKDTGETVGACGLYKRENLEHPDIGFAFLGEHTGKGFGYESAKAVLDYAKNDLGIQTILGFTVKDNEASIKLLEKLGLEKAGSYRFEGDAEELLLFSN